MEFEFEETQATYQSGSQRARVWTEQWVSRWAYCPNCGKSQLSQFSANLPVADFFCGDCNDQFELKSQKKAFGRKVADGAYSTKIERLSSATNPNLMLLNYDLARLSVTDICIVPKHFFIPEIIERRNPLAPTARRAGWVGSNILLDRIPASGRIVIVQNGIPNSRESVLKKWRKTLFLRHEEVGARGWLIEVMNCLEKIGSSEFDLDDVYAFERHLSRIYPNNQNIKPKIRQQLQVLRDNGYLEFIGRGSYRLHSI